MNVCLTDWILLTRLISRSVFIPPQSARADVLSGQLSAPQKVCEGALWWEGVLCSLSRGAAKLRRRPGRTGGGAAPQQPLFVWFQQILESGINSVGRVHPSSEHVQSQEETPVLEAAAHTPEHTHGTHTHSGTQALAALRAMEDDCLAPSSLQGHQHHLRLDQRPAL